MEVELYENIKYTLPEQPKEKKIFGYNKEQKKQKWERTTLPDDFDFLSEEEQFNFAAEEDRRCVEGYWFFNNGQPTYITGDHYFYLNWFQLKDTDRSYPDYRDSDRKWFYMWDICYKDPDCLGLIYLKKRRDGFSYRSISVVLNSARRTFKGVYGMVSKTGDDAQKMFFKLTYAFSKLPSFFKPQVESSENVKKILSFKSPAQRVTFKNKSTKDTISLDTIIDWKNTSENSYDGDAITICVGDEGGKWEEADFDKWVQVVTTTCTSGETIRGKLLLGSTMNEPNEENKTKKRSKFKGSLAFKEVWDKSSYKEKSEIDRTNSGLYRYFLPAYEGYEGYIDEFGNSITENPVTEIFDLSGQKIMFGAKPRLEKRRKSLRDSNKLSAFYEECRQRPFTEQEAFYSSMNDSDAFDKDRIISQIEHNSYLLSANKVLIRGNFEWMSGIRDGSVVFQECENGRWLVYWLPPEDQRNKKLIKHGRYSPGNTEIGVFSLDPYQSKTTASNKRSMAASHGFRKYDALNIEMSNIFVTQYWARPNDPMIVYEDMIKQSVFYGWPLLIEKNKNNCIEYFQNRGYNNYLMKRPAFTQTEWSLKGGDVEDIGIANSGQAVREQMIEHLASYISNNIGHIEAIGKFGNCPFQDTLQDWLNFDPNKWTDYDLTVSAMLVLIGSRSYTPQKIERKAIELFQKYDTRGIVSRPIK